MTRKLIGLLLILILCGASWLLFETKHKAVNPIVFKANTQELVVGVNQEKAIIRHSNAQTTTAESLIKEASHNEFSEDPYVEAYSINRRSISCSRFESYWSSREFEPDKQKLINSAVKLCAQWRSQSPLLTAQKVDISSLPATSKVGQLLKSWPNLLIDNHALRERALYSIDFLSEAVKVKNYHLVDRALSDVLFWPESFFQSIIGGVDPYYQQEIFKIAMKVLGCDFSQADHCAADSSEMINHCFDDAKNCGLTYPQWIENTLLPGMHKDVAMIVSHYRQISDAN